MPDSSHIPLDIPLQPAIDLRPSAVVAEGLLNPRGICADSDGSLLLAEAGTGAPDQPFSGRISRLRPDPLTLGAYLPPEIVAAGFRSMNMQSRMCRDEIMGLSDIACGGGHRLASQTDYVEGSKILDLQYFPPEPVFRGRGNLNALCYHPTRRSWLATQPDTNQLVEFSGDGDGRMLVQLPELDDGQEAVPVALIHEAATDAVLVSLFSGELRNDPARRGINFAERAGAVVRVHPDSGEIATVIRGLQLPTGLALAPDGRLFVLELCDALLQPLTPEWQGEPRHGGFRRFSGRLLSCDLQSGDVRILATDLDTPSNICIVAGAALISEGMGLTGRPLPMPGGGTVPLSGRIRRVQIG